MGAVWWGITLIAIGGLLLVNQFLPDVALWRYWPLIIVAVGVRGMFGSSSGRWSLKDAAEGLTVVAVGLVLLGQMLGYLEWGVWLSILKLWPLLLDSIGLDIIGRAIHAESIRVLASLVIVGGIAYGALAMPPGAGWPPTWFVTTGESTPFSERAPSSALVEEGSAAIAAGVGRFTLEAGDALATAEGRSPLRLSFDAQTRGRTAELDIALKGSTVGPTRDSELDVTLDRDVTWDLEIDAGVSSFDVDLSRLAVSSLDFKAGVSEGTLTLGLPSGVAEAMIEGGVSSLTVRVPKGTDVRVSVRSGLSAVDFRGEWDRGGNGDRRVYTTPRFSDSGDYWDIEIAAGIGALTVEYY
jgi:hypothetical protein